MYMIYTYSILYEDILALLLQIANMLVISISIKWLFKKKFNQIWYLKEIKLKKD